MIDMPFVLSSKGCWHKHYNNKKKVYISCICNACNCNTFESWRLILMSTHITQLPWMCSCHSLRTVPFTTNEYLPESLSSTFLIFNQNLLLFLLNPKDILSIFEISFWVSFSQCDLCKALSKSRTFDLYISRADCPVTQLSWKSLGWLSCRKNGKCN